MISRWSLFWIGMFLAVVYMTFIAGCGGGGDTDADQDPAVQPVVVNSLDFTCIDVANDLACDAELDAVGIFNSGPVRISGSPMPHDYINLRLLSTLDLDASVFVHMPMNIKGCVLDLWPLRSLILPLGRLWTSLLPSGVIGAAPWDSMRMWQLFITAAISIPGIMHPRISIRGTRPLPMLWSDGRM